MKIGKKVWWLAPFVVLMAVIWLGGCRPSSSKVALWMEEEEKVRVLSTIGMIHDLVVQVGGERVHPLVLIEGALDPHSYELVKGDDEKLRRAELIFYNGLCLEHAPSLTRSICHHDCAIPLGDAILARDPTSTIWVDGEVDPHIWMDVSLWAQGAQVIAEALSAFDPEGTDFYHSRAQRLTWQLEELDRKIGSTLEQIPKERRYLVSGHDAFNYFARRYLATEEERTLGGWEVRSAAPEGLAPEGQLGGAHLREVLSYLQEHQIEVIFPESNLNLDAIRKITEAGRKMGIPILMARESLYGDAMGVPGSNGDTYAKMVWHNAAIVAKHLGGIDCEGGAFNETR